ncbi:unnamed protein product [Enterobius vermicularis]|uniref:Uncharacterized protein n=1 Tax=Enterobius vermicularis TaxID=51028 RepID=A0A0N4VRA3_ENTVE|nr:unnamed protein product [Enterobius vermicularis]
MLLSSKSAAVLGPSRSSSPSLSSSNGMPSLSFVVFTVALIVDWEREGSSPEEKLKRIAKIDAWLNRDQYE